MRSTRLLRWALVTGAVLATACGGSNDELEVPPEGSVVPVVEVAGASSLRISWRSVSVEGATPIRGYQLERRRNLTGSFSAIGETLQPQGDSVVYLDEGLESETIYGYRYRIVSYDGALSAPSVVVGGTTAPPPGIAVRVSTRGTLNTQGYQVALMGPESREFPIGAQETRRVSPLELGEYSVTLRGVPSGCAVAGDTTRSARPPATGARTIDTVAYQVECRDPNRGSIVVRANGPAELAEPLQFRIEAILDTIVIVQDRSAPVNLATEFDNLLPGAYTVLLRNLPAGCSVEGSQSRPAIVTALGTDSVAFVLTCTGGEDPGTQCVEPPPRDPAKAYLLRAAWSAESAAPGATIDLTLTTELTTGTTFGSLQYLLEWDASRLELVSLTKLNEELTLTLGPTQNSSRRVSILTVEPLGGVLQLVRASFRVKAGATPGCLASRTNVGAQVPGEFLSGGFANLLPQTQVLDDNLAIVAGGALPGPNTPPIARPGGPYSAVVGQAVTFDGAQSSDADGRIVSYSWNPGDGGSALTGPSPSKVYAAAGTYTLRLTVVDDDGASGSASTTVSVSSGSGGGPANVPPVARAGGPYTATVNVPLTLNGTGSSDSDGAIVSYSWNLGNGQGPVTGASPTVSFASPGSYTVTLTVTDDDGATGSATSTVTVSAGSGGGGDGVPLRMVFQPGAVAGTIDLLVYLDLSADRPETPGPERLQSWSLARLEWNERVLRYRSFTTGTGWGVIRPALSGTNATTGLRTLSTPTSEFAGSGTNNGDLVLLARIGFDAVGAPGTSTTTVTTPGVLLSQSGFSYVTLVRVQEGTYSRP